MIQTMFRYVVPVNFDDFALFKSWNPHTTIIIWTHLNYQKSFYLFLFNLFSNIWQQKSCDEKKSVVNCDLFEIVVSRIFIIWILRIPVCVISVPLGFNVFKHQHKLIKQLTFVFTWKQTHTSLRVHTCCTAHCRAYHPNRKRKKSKQHLFQQGRMENS